MNAFTDSIVDEFMGPTPTQDELTVVNGSKEASRGEFVATSTPLAAVTTPEETKPALWPQLDGVSQAEIMKAKQHIVNAESAAMTGTNIEEELRQLKSRNKALEMEVMILDTKLSILSQAAACSF